MPIIKSAAKKMRQDKKRTQLNKKYEKAYKDALKNLKKLKKATPESLKKVFSQIDKAAKKNVISKQRAGRLKSLASKLVSKPK